MNTEKLSRPWPRLCTVLVAGGLGLSALGLATGIAQATPAPAPAFPHHWCPGDRWDPGWGNNWDWGNCHDWDDNFAPAGWAAPPPWAATAALVGTLGTRRLEPRCE